MNIKDYAKIVLNMNDEVKTKQAIEKLKHGVKHEEKWSEEHKIEVIKLIGFLQSGSTNIEDLEKY